MNRGDSFPMTATYQSATVGREAGLDDRYARLATAGLDIECRSAAPSKM